MLKKYRIHVLSAQEGGGGGTKYTIYAPVIVIQVKETSGFSV